MGLEVGEGKGMPELSWGSQIYPGFHQHLVLWSPTPCIWSPLSRLWGARGGTLWYCRRHHCLLQPLGFPSPPGGIPAEEGAQQHELGGGLG